MINIDLDDTFTIYKYYGIYILKQGLTLNKEVYKIFSSGKTEGIFQFETPLLRNIIKKIEPTCFQDLVAGIALGRPGTIDEVDTYVLRKKGKEKVDYIDKTLEGILKETYGIIIYQEQIMAILRVVAGYTLAEADLIRRAISKKKENIINEEKEKFINKSLKRGYKLDVVLKIYDLIVKFANYGFNKSHSVAYAYIAYQMAYLKFKYPEYFIIEMINGKDSDKIRDSISFLKSKGFRIIKPDINLSKNGFYVRNKDVMMPFIQVKGINEDVAKKIIEVRDIGFKDIFDFAYKTRDFINEDIFKKLVKAGLFDTDISSYGDYPDKANNKNHAYSLSIEYGKTIELSKERGVFIEPQAQFIMGRLSSSSYTTDRGNHVYMGGVNSYIGRLGFVLGQKTSENNDVYFKANLLHEFGGDRDIYMRAANGETLSDSRDYGDTWFELGLGTNVKLGNSSHFYGDIERSFGADIQKKWQINAGVRFEF